MPVLVQGVAGQIVWKTEEVTRALGQAKGRKSRWADSLCIALVNNMPDLALQDTELQFFEILGEACGTVPVLVKLFSLPEIARTERVRDRLDSTYFGIGELWNSHFDAVIVTGTEPHHEDLRDEPYWSTLTDVLDWAEANTSSAVLSCLAAHAGVLHREGIPRSPLSDKQFGVFDFRAAREHALLEDVEPPLSIPHSRWNEVKSDALTACGYSVVTESSEAGVDLFVRKSRNSLFVHFQGHPEYDKLTLFKEYRRDVRRFLKRERDGYPSLPCGYFDAVTAQAMQQFQASAIANRSEDRMAEFPERTATANLVSTWRSGAVSIYRRWLEYIRSRKAAQSRAPVRAGIAPLRPFTTGSVLPVNPEVV